MSGQNPFAGQNRFLTGSGFRGFLGQKELKTPNVWSEPLRRSEPVFNW
jgi:hypothetical protein